MKIRVLIACLLAAVSSYGVDGVWTNLGGGDWTDTNNWQNGVVASGVDSIANFSTLDITASNTVTLPTTQTVGTLLFGDVTPSHDWSLVGSNLTLAVSSGDPLLYVSNRTLSIACDISGTQGLKKTGAGTLVLSGTNTYTGTNTIQAGILSVSTNNNLGADTSRATRSDIVFDGGTLLATGSFTDTHRTWTFTTNTGGTTIVPSGVSLRKLHNPAVAFYSYFVGSGPWTIKGGGTFIVEKNPGGACTYSGDMYIQDDNTTLVNTGLRQQGQLGTDGTMYFSHNTRHWSYSSLVGWINKHRRITGDVYFKAVYSAPYVFFGAPTVYDITLTPGSTLHFQTDDAKSYYVYFGKLVMQTNTTVEYEGGVAFAQTYDAWTGISDGGNGYSFTKIGTGTLDLQTTNQSWGATYLTGGNIRQLVANGLPTNTTLVFSGLTNTLNLNGFSQQLGGIAEVTSDSSHVITSAGAATLTLNNTSSNTFGGNIDGSLSLAKYGVGTLTLSSTNTYTGTTLLSNGKLLVNGTLDSSANLITVTNMGTLGGTGTIRRAVTVANGGTLRPGSSIGKLTITNNTSFATGSTFSWEASAYTSESDVGGAGTNYSQLAMSSGATFTIASGTLGKLYFPMGEDFNGSFWDSIRSWDIITGGSSSSSGSITNTDISIFVNDSPHTTSRGTFNTAYVVDGILRLTWTPNEAQVVPAIRNRLRNKNHLLVY